MPAVGLLHHIHGQEAQGVDALLVEVCCDFHGVALPGWLCVSVAYLPAPSLDTFHLLHRHHPCQSSNQLFFLKDKQVPGMCRPGSLLKFHSQW
jgi:hypothetical protein